MKDIVCGTKKINQYQGELGTNNNSNMSSTSENSIKAKILKDPEKDKCRLSLIREIKLTTFHALTDLLELRTDKITYLRKLYQIITTELIVATNIIINFPAFDYFSQGFDFDD